MVLVMLRVMALSLLRDRAGLMLTFVLPPVVFIVFASVFGASASGRLDVRAGVVDHIANADSHRLVQTLDRRLDHRLTLFVAQPALTQAISDGRVDAGLVLRGDLAADPAPAMILFHPGRQAAGEVLTAKVMAAALQGLPNLMLSRKAASLAPALSLTQDQRQRLAVAHISEPAAPFVSQQTLGGGDPIVSYYAGSVSILFLMFSSMQGAMSLIDERRSGLRLRLSLSVGGVGPLLVGRMLWLVALGVAQASALFSVAAAVYRIPLLESFGPWLVTAVCAAAASAGLTLCLAAACQTREQAQTLSNFLILILAAVGGSMAPRFLMPAALQSLGRLTPHAWVIDAYQGVLWRRVVDVQVIEAWGILSGFALIGFVGALVVERRRRL